MLAAPAIIAPYERRRRSVGSAGLRGLGGQISLTLTKNEEHPDQECERLCSNDQHRQYDDLLAKFSDISIVTRAVNLYLHRCLFALALVNK